MAENDFQKEIKKVTKRAIHERGQDLALLKSLILQSWFSVLKTIHPAQ